MFVMARSVWEAMKARAGEPVEIDLSQTPMAKLATLADFEAAVAERKSDYEARITIYRHDAKDHPFPINVDTYVVWERVPDHLDFMAMVITASTCNNANMRGFLADHVFLVKEERGSGGSAHWLPELPDKIVATVKKRDPKLGFGL
jgi:hypothetical protein